jgi:S-adenosylmethionine:diacylglycerol 3-amino-3-carboxypropyl transferase
MGSPLEKLGTEMVRETIRRNNTLREAAKELGVTPGAITQFMARHKLEKVTFLQVADALARVVTDEQLSAVQAQITRQRWAILTPEQRVMRTANARAARRSLPIGRRSEIAKKAWATRRAKAGN